MNKTIWKFPIPIKRSFELELPSNSDILYLQVQDNSPCLWIKVNPLENEKIHRHFMFIATGQAENEENLKNYIGTIMLSNSVYHLFEIK